MKAIESRYYLTITTKSDKPEHTTFWFGRADMKDNLRPVKIEAPDVKSAWRKLEEHDEGK